eukprot:scaffold2951_cov99-Isochrysis_galbana.AAC.6
MAICSSIRRSSTEKLWRSREPKEVDKDPGVVGAAENEKPVRAEGGGADRHLPNAGDGVDRQADDSLERAQERLDGEDPAALGRARFPDQGVGRPRDGGGAGERAWPAERGAGSRVVRERDERHVGQRGQPPHGLLRLAVLLVALGVHDVRPAHMRLQECDGRIEHPAERGGDVPVERVAQRSVYVALHRPEQQGLHRRVGDCGGDQPALGSVDLERQRGIAILHPEGRAELEPGALAVLHRPDRRHLVTHPDGRRLRREIDGALLVVEHVDRPPTVARDLELAQRARDRDYAAPSIEWADRDPRLNRRDRDGHIPEHLVDDRVVVHRQAAGCGQRVAVRRAAAHTGQQQESGPHGRDPIFVPDGRTTRRTSR